MACLSRRLPKPTWREDFKKISADIYFWPNYDCLEEKEATIQILLETSAGTHKPMQSWDKLKTSNSIQEPKTDQPAKCNSNSNPWQTPGAAPKPLSTSMDLGQAETLAPEEKL